MRKSHNDTPIFDESGILRSLDFARLYFWDLICRDAGANLSPGWRCKMSCLSRLSSVKFRLTDYYGARVTLACLSKWLSAVSRYIIRFSILSKYRCSVSLHWAFLVAYICLDDYLSKSYSWFPYMSISFILLPTSTHTLPEDRWRIYECSSESLE